MKNPVIQLKIVLKDVEPIVWRRLQVPAKISMRELHEILNVTMGWANYHLYSFRVGELTIGNTKFVDVDSFTDDRKVKLIDVASSSKRFYYLYDMGDAWDHEVKIESVFEADSRKKYPLCVKGENACPPEDCGGRSGFAHFKEVMANPKSSEYRSLRRWYGKKFDLAEFDAAYLNRYRLRNRRQLGVPARRCQQISLNEH